MVADGFCHEYIIQEDMSKRTSLTLQAPSDENEYNHLLRKFRLCDLLTRISKEAVALYKDTVEGGLRGFKQTQIDMTNMITKKVVKQDVMVTAWGLVDLAYEAVLATNDHRGKDTITDKELYFLALASSSFQNKRYSESRKNSPEWKDLDFMLYLGGFTGEQFKMQKPGTVLESAARDLYILLVLSKTNGFMEDLEKCIAIEAGTHWKNLLTSLLLMWVTSTGDIDMSVLEASVAWDADFSLKDFRAVLNRYTSTYKEIKRSPLARQVFTAKPYVKTDSNHVFCVNCFLNIHLSEHAIMWIVRDYYHNNGKNNFPSIFGSLFEMYFQELMDTYVEKENFEKLPECGNPRADWKLILNGHLILIEQKSSLLRLDAKQQEPNIDAMRDFVTRNIVQGLKQLRSTEEDLKLDRCIKIVLLYEGHLKIDIMDWIIQNAGIIDDGYYWLATIDEIEVLLYQYKNNLPLFEAVVAEKLKLHSEKSNEGRNLEQLFHAKGMLENQHLIQEKFEYYNRLAEKEAEQRLKSH